MGVIVKGDFWDLVSWKLEVDEVIHNEGLRSWSLENAAGIKEWIKLCS